MSGGRERYAQRRRQISGVRDERLRLVLDIDMVISVRSGRRNWGNSPLLFAEVLAPLLPIPPDLRAPMPVFHQKDHDKDDRANENGPELTWEQGDDKGCQRRLGERLESRGREEDGWNIANKSSEEENVEDGGGERLDASK